MAVIEPAVTGYLTTYKIRSGILLFLVIQLYFCHYKALVLTIELIYLPNMASVGRLDQITGLVDYTWFTDSHKCICIFNGNLSLPLKAGQSCDVARSLDGKIASVAAHSYTYRTALAAGNVPLPDPGCIVSLVLELTCHQELSLNLQIIHRRIPLGKP